MARLIHHCVTRGISALLAGIALPLPVAHAAIEDCRGIEADTERLRCYDREAAKPASSAQQTDGDEIQFDPWRFHPARARDAPTSLLDSRWELSPARKRGTFIFRPYKPVYFMPAFYVSQPNQTPDSENPQNRVVEEQGLDSTEAKFQLSFKTKLWENVIGDNGDVWLGYTQVSHWQLYNGDLSKPFRETNHEPEVLFVWRTDYPFLAGFRGRMLGLSLDHQSNGRSNPFSRSWNRVILSAGFERQDWTLTLRPWWRLAEDENNDDNPKIEDYTGRADLKLVRKWKAYEASALLRHSLRDGDRSHGAVQLDWAFPLKGNLRGHLQYFNGYGESLIDYNHRTWYLGLGISLLEWY